MNGYIVIALDIFFVLAMWLHFGHVAGILALCYVGIMAFALARYNRFAMRVIVTMREKIEELTGRPYTGPTD